MKRISALTLSILAILVVSSHALAAHNQQVLGSSTDTSEINFPPVTAGPGFILPDSPFYFLDEFKQNVKLSLAMGARTRSLTHLDIAGERLAELRAMIQRNNQKGIALALMGISSETQKAVDNLADAKAQGKDVEKLAKDITAHIKETREILKNVSDQSDLDLSLSLEAARENLRNSKILAENYLPEPDLQNEIADNIFERLDQVVLGVSVSSSKIAYATDEYEKMASSAATRTLEMRKKALEEARKANDTSKIKEEEQKITQETAKQKKFFLALEKALESAREALQNGEIATQNYKTAKESLKQIKLEDN